MANQKSLIQVNLVNYKNTEENIMTNTNHMQDMYNMIRENRLAIYAKPRRYYNRDGQGGSAFKFLFLVEAIVFILMMTTVGGALAQSPANATMMLAGTEQQNGNSVMNYSTVYNSGKVFINWTAKNELTDCIYVVERSANDKEYTSVGVKEGIGSEIELFYSWVDQAPPAGYVYYRIKKITKEGTQSFSASNAIINQGSSFNTKANYAQESKPAK